MSGFFFNNFSCIFPRGVGIGIGAGVDIRLFFFFFFSFFEIVDRNSIKPAVVVSHANGYIFACSWDEFVPADRLRKMNEENLRLQKELNDNTKPSKRTNPTPNSKAGMKMSSKAGSEDLPGSSGNLPPRGQKRGRELEIEKVCTLSIE